ncbi:C40 family peptidase [Streptomyces qinzhouensis]|uniref:C40 family peptidase n=1 Tax=Streptomyces qinzhouensis TaxID=2599401 RepID=UPI001645D88C|nr:C40 family peptidase [Streptomyces qinzhouensis]
MAAHRKPKQTRRYPFAARPAARTATSLVLAGAATATVFNGTGTADTVLTPAQIKARVDKLYQEAEAATEEYNGAKERTDGAREELDRLRDESARRAERLNAGRDALGSIAAAQYRAGAVDPVIRLALESDPDGFLERAAIDRLVGDRHAAAAADVRGRLADLNRLRDLAGHRVGELRSHQDELARRKAVVQRKLAAAEGMLKRLDTPQRAAYDAPGADRLGAQSRPPAVTATSSRAARAVAYAYGALGKPYVWGATGPASYDCSGLTRAAWRAAGVSLPRTTYTQIGAGRRVARSELAPGDLVFFYPGVSHVGLYVGGGRMIHAPRPGAQVRIASVDEMPFAGATRPA